MDQLDTWRRTHFSKELHNQYEGGEPAEGDGAPELPVVIVAGHVQDIRNLGGIAFIHVRDRQGVIQVTADKDVLGDEVFGAMTGLNRESALMVRGRPVPNPKVRGGVEVLPEAFRLVGEAETPLPLGVVDKVFADMDTRLDNRYLDLRKEGVMALFTIRSAMLRGVRDEFTERAFVEVNTPKIVATATEGGTALFPMQYFDKPAYLNQSPQLFKQMLMATDLDRVFEIGPAFRAEEHDTSRHINEFTSIDMEMCYSDEEDVMEVLEGVVVRACKYLAEDCADEVEALNRWREGQNKLIERENQGLRKQNKKLRSQKKPELPLREEWGPVSISVPETPFPRRTYTELVELVQGEGLKMEWGEDLSMEANRIIGAKYPEFFFITKWPSEGKPFYALPYHDEPKMCRAFDLNFAEKELASGAQRVHDPKLLEERIAAQGLDPGSFGFYLNAFRYGMPPHAGWGLGTERLLMVLTDTPNVRETILFPRDKHRLVP